jgi:uncharacterized metal-binding protein YceD (DUF177 family)
MQTRKEYIIQFVGLSVGTHLFEFDINDKFFESLDYSEIKQGNIQVKLSLLKQSNMMVLQFEISGTVKTSCDRCTVQFDLPVNANYKLIVKIGGSDTGNEDDDIVTIAANEHELDLSQHLYEYITLSLPIKRVHPDNLKGETTCDKKMLKELNNYLTENEEKSPSDPRWEELRKIKLN